MTIRIRRIHLSGGREHQHISSLEWTQENSTVAKVSSRGEIVSFIESKGAAYVLDQSGHRVAVGVVVPSHGDKYLRTHRDGVWTDNLLALPKF